MKNITLLISFVLVGFLVVDDLNAQRRGGGGGGRGGGGGGRSFSGGGAARSMGGSSSFNRPSSMPSYNRPSPSSFNRPSGASSFNRPSGASSLNRPSGASSFNRPSGAGSLNRGAGASSLGGQRTANDYRSSSRSQLNNFLNMPSSSGASTASSGRTRASSAGTPNDSGGRNFQGENYSVDTFKGSGSGSSGGTNYAGAGRGAVITDSQGNQKVVGKGVGAASDGTNAVAGRGGFAGGTNVDGSSGAVRGGTRVATDGTNVAASRGAVGGVRDSQGNVRGGAAGGWAASDGTNTVGGAGGVRGQSNADGSGGYVARGARGATDGTNAVVQRGASAGVQDRYGNARGATVGGTRATDGVNTWGQAGGARYVKDPAGNVYARGGYATGYNGVVTSRQQAYAVRNGYTGYTRYYNSAWHARYPGAWFVAGMAAASWYAAPSYGYASGYTGCAEEPVSYDYGDDGITTVDGNVYAGDQQIATEEEYYDQASDIAGDYQADDKADDDEAGDWMPLGVFAVVSKDQTKSDMTLQLAINKEGMIRGNLTLDLTNEVIQVKGALDKKTQRVAFRLDDKPDIVVDCGLYNLTQDVLTVLVHQGKDKQEQRGLVRLQPDKEKKEAAS